MDLIEAVQKCWMMNGLENFYRKLYQQQGELKRGQNYGESISVYEIIYNVELQTLASDDTLSMFGCKINHYI
jgi:hypothetical protein